MHYAEMFSQSMLQLVFEVTVPQVIVQLHDAPAQKMAPAILALGPMENP